MKKKKLYLRTFFNKPILRLLMTNKSLNRSNSRNLLGRKEIESLFLRKKKSRINYLQLSIKKDRNKTKMNKNLKLLKKYWKKNFLKKSLINFLINKKSKSQ